MKKFIVSPSNSLKGNVTVPGDKSISHRALLLGALAEGQTIINNLLMGDDVLATLKALKQCGVNIVEKNGVVTVDGVGLYGLTKPTKPLYMGNAGTAMRLMAGIMAGQDFDCVLYGDESLNKRPMRRIINPLEQMGVKVDSQHGLPPLEISKSNSLKSISYTLPMASAQVKSCILLAGLYCDGITEVISPAPSRDHTERMLSQFGVKVSENKNSIKIQGKQKLVSTDITVPGDISSAAFFIVGGLIANESNLLLKNIGVNPTRTGVLEILRLMGADLALTPNLNNNHNTEPTADILIKPSRLHGITIPEALVPLAIDEFPILMIAASCAQGKTVLKGARELRVKETDRIAAMAEGLEKLGINVEVFEDGMAVLGKGEFLGGEINSHGDHRIAMSFALAGLRANAPIKINSIDNVKTSFPNFSILSKQLGLNIEVVD